MRIICEIGLNHLGDVEYSRDILNSLLDKNVWGITYQVREISFYKNPDFSHLMLNENEYSYIKSLCASSDKKFGIALADPEKLEFFENVGVDFYKTLSWDIQNYIYLMKLSSTQKEIFISTGMSSYADLVDWSREVMSKNISDDKFSLIHTQLDSSINSTHLNAIPYLRSSFKYPIGYLNHCENPLVIYLSIGFVPDFLFLYVKLSKEVKHIDEDHSLYIDTLDGIIENIDSLKCALGSKFKERIEHKDKFLRNNSDS